MKLILLGAPGAGKGTQAEILSSRLGIPTISTGNILRAAVKNGTPVGLKAKEYMDAGKLVPDEVIIGIVAERLAEPDCAKGYILDGVPRTIAQAEALEAKGITFDKVLSIEISDETIVERMGGRVRVVDTESVTMGANILARYGLRLLGQGLGLEEAAAELERARRRVHVLAMLDTLEYLRRGGRVTGLAALAGGLLAIKPVVTLRDGLVSVIGKARGSKNAENLLTQTIDRCGVDFSMPYTLGYTGLSDAMLHKYKADSARLWAGKAEDLPVMLIGSVIGTHAGPGAVGVAFFALRDE